VEPRQLFFLKLCYCVIDVKKCGAFCCLLIRRAQVLILVMLIYDRKKNEFFTNESIYILILISPVLPKLYCSKLGLRSKIRILEALLHLKFVYIFATIFRCSLSCAALRSLACRMLYIHIQMLAFVYFSTPTVYDFTFPVLYLESKVGI
jgi:hypothetical protein